jgi:hypothetical protein
MVQNIIENQLYMAACFDKENKTYVVNKYMEHRDEISNKMDIEADEDLGCNSNEGGILLERLVINAVEIPGITDLVMKEHGIELKELGRKVIVYEYETDAVKVNEERFVIGLAYEHGEDIVIHSWHDVKDYINSTKPITSGFDFEKTRNALLDILTHTTGDKLVAEYLILLITSKLLNRVNSYNLGNMSLNLITNDQPAESAEVLLKAFELVMKDIVHFELTMPITIDYLNKSSIIPRFDVNTEELKQGLLQLVDNTFLVINELGLKEGKLDQNGCKAFTGIKSLIDFQTLHFDYPYSSIEIFYNIPILILSESKSLFDSLGLIKMKLNKDSKVNCYVSPDEDTLRLFRQWFGYVRYSEFVSKFSAPPEVMEKIAKDMAGLGHDEIDTRVRLTKLYSLSKGKEAFNFEDYEYIKNCEIERLSRLNDIKNS